MIRGRLKGLIVASALSLVVLGLSGCSAPNIEAFLKTDITNAMTARVNANKAIVTKLYVSGLLGDGEKETIEKNIDEQMAVYLSSDLATNKALQDKLLASVVDWAAPDWEDYGGEDPKEPNSAGYTKDEWNEQIVTTFIKNKKLEGKFKIPVFKEDSLVQPISIIDGKTAELVNSRFGYKVYVLKPFNNSNKPEALDETIEMIKAATVNKDDIDDSVMGRLFQVAKDEDDKEVTLLDISKRSNQVVSDSIGSPLVSDSVYEFEGKSLKEVTKGNKVISSLSVGNKSLSTPRKDAEPGKDMVISDKSGDVPLFAMRFYEFNEEAVTNIIKTLGMNPDQYLFTTYGGENRVYIMEYPVSYVTDIRDKSDDANSYECDFGVSNMGINLRTGKLIKYGKAWGNEEEPGVYFEDSEPYLSVSGSKSASEEGQSAFVIETETPDDARIEVGEYKAKVKTGRIILRDYLEASYAPNVISGENLVVFGRKIRMLKFSGSKSDVVAKYYDKEGKVIQDSPTLMIDDFADFAALAEQKASIKYVGRIGETESSATADNSGNEDKNKNLKDSLERIDSLDKEVVTSISPTEQFPGSKLGVIDNGKGAKPLFYAMAVKKNMFDTALFSGWINNTSPDKNSLEWWSKWLGNESRGYSYSINKTVLEEYLMGNYVFELQKSGIIVLDLQTINKIHKEYVQQDKVDSTRSFRTFFVVLGWALISYSFILLIAWALDTNVDLGFNILEKLTFGHWIAIKDPNEVPHTDLGERKYISFQPLVLRAIGISLVGVLLILVNVVEVVSYLVTALSGIAEYIGKLITGI